MAVTINRSLNLVVPLLRGDGTRLYVHSTPIQPETFEQYHLVLAKTFSAFAENGILVSSAPSIAKMILKDVATMTPRAQGLNWWDGPDGVGGEAGLLAEIVRRSNVLAPTDKGWGSLPLQNALDAGQIDEEEKSEVLNILTFFTVVSRVPPKSVREGMVLGMARLYQLETTSLNATEYAVSLKTLTLDVSTGESPQP